MLLTRLSHKSDVTLTYHQMESDIGIYPQVIRSYMFPNGVVKVQISEQLQKGNSVIRAGLDAKKKQICNLLSIEKKLLYCEIEHKKMI